MSPVAFLLMLVCMGTPSAYSDVSNDKTVYVVHYRQGRNVIPITVELDYEKKIGHVLNLNPKTAGKSVTFYDFRQRAVAYKYLNSNQCFISRLSEETLQSESKSWKKLEKKVINEASIETLWASTRIVTPKQLYRFAGERINEFCKGATSFLVTSSEYELLKFRRKRETAPSQQKGQFSHRSYGHYGHQSHNYAHYGHETYSGGRVVSSGEATQTLEQQQIRREAAPGGVLQPPPSQGSAGHFGGSGTGGSEGFALRSGFEGGYQLNHPLGIRAGSQYRGGINAQGQYATDSARHPSGVLTSVSRVPGMPATRADSSRIPGATLPSLPSVRVPGVPSTTDIAGRPGAPADYLSRRDAQPGVLSPGYPGHPSSGIGLPSYPSSIVTQPGYPSAVTQPGYQVPGQPPCCQPKTEVPAVSPDRPGIRVRPEVPATPVQPHGYPSRGVIQPGYPPTGIAQPSYPLPEISRPTYLPAGIDQPGYPPLSVGHPSYPSGVHGVRDIGTAAPLVPHGYPSLGVAQPSYSGTAGPGYSPSEIPHPGYITPTVTHPGYPGVITQPGYQVPGQPPCCQPKVPVVAPAFPGVTPPRDARITPDDRRPPVEPRGYPPLGIEQPGYLPSGISEPGYPSPGISQPGYPSPGISQPGYPPPGIPQPGYPPSGISQPGYPPSGISQPGYPSPGISQPGYPPSGILQPGVPSTGIGQPGYPPDRTAYPGYQPEGYPSPGYPSLGVDQPGYPSRPTSRPGFPSRGRDRPVVPFRDADVSYPSTTVARPGYPGIDQPGYLPPGIGQPGYPSHSVLQPVRPPTAISSPGMQPGYTPGIVPPGYPVHPGYPIQPGYQPPGADTTRPAHLRPPEVGNGLVSTGYPSGTYPLRTLDSIPIEQRPGHAQLPAVSRTPGTYPTSPVPPERALVPGRPGYPVPGGTPLDQVGHPRDGVTAVRSEGDTAVSQTQVQTGYEGTAAEATSIGRRGGLGAQTQVQGGYTGNGSFSAQAQSGFTGGVTQSQVRGGKQGGSSGSSAQVERVGSAQSQVQVGKPSGAATSSAQGKFLRGVTQVQAQSGKTGGSAGAQAQSMGTSSSQVQVNVADSGAQTENGFQGGVSASVSGSHSGGQAQTQLQGSYDSGRTYVATAQGGFDSASEFRGAVPGVGSIPEMAARPLNGRLQPPSGPVDGQYLQRPLIGAPGLRPDQISQTPGYQQLRPGEGDTAYQREYRFPNGSVRVMRNGARDQIGISRRTEESGPRSGIGIPQLPGNGMVGAPGIPQVPGRHPTTYPGHPGLDESTRVPSPLAPHLPGGITHHVEPTRMDTRQVFHPTYTQRAVVPGSVPQVHGELPYGPGFSLPSGQIPGTETRGAIDTASRAADIPAFPIRPGHMIPSPISAGFPGLTPSSSQLPGIHPVDSRLQPGSGILRPSDFSGTTAPFDDAQRRHLPGFTRVTPDVPGQLVPGDYVPGHIAIPARHDRERVPGVYPEDGVTQIHRTSPPRPEYQPYDHRERRPPQETVRPLIPQPGHIPDSAHAVNISREVRPRVPSTHPRDPSLPTSRDPPVPDCCKPKRDWRTRCCQSLNGKQNGDTYTKPRCCTSKHSDGDDDLNGDSDFHDDVDEKDTCRVVKAVCYLVYKPNGRARVCKPTGTRGC